MGSVAVAVCVGGLSPPQEVGTNSVAIADVLGTIDDGASFSDDATDEYKRSVVVTGKVKVA
jgi:hypothetical protein